MRGKFIMYNDLFVVVRLHQWNIISYYVYIKVDLNDFEPIGEAHSFTTNLN